jgi:hypothetical protein
MTTEQISHESSILARVVICSFKDNKTAKAWLDANGEYYPQGDRVVSKALEKIRRILGSEGFNLKAYKAKHKKVIK